MATDWLAEYVREQTRAVALRFPDRAVDMEKARALLLYVTIGHAAYLRADGTVLLQDAEDQWTEASGKERWGSLVLGAQHFPELRRLLPKRADGAISCVTCAGSSCVQGVVCWNCGGLGWTGEGAA